MINFMETLGRIYPRVRASCFDDPTVYENIVWEGGDPLPTESEMINSELQAEKDQAWDNIMSLRDVKRAGGIKIGDFWFHSDDTSRIQQIGLVLLGTNIPPGLQWKTMSGAFATMTPALAQSIFQGIAVKDTQIFTVTEQHHLNVLTSQDPGNYDYTVGWPTIYADTV